MMEVMKIQEYDSIKLKNVSLMKAEHMKLQPHTQDFLKLSNPKALLETSLRNFSCLTTGDTIMIMHDNKKLYINILETKPSPAVCMIDTDCEVDFAPPLDYEEPRKPVKKVLEPSKVPVKQQAIVKEEEKVKAFIPFSGKARRLDGMPRSGQNEKELLAAEGKGKSTCAEAPEPRKAGGKLVFDSRSGKEKAEASVKEDTKREETVKSTEKFQSFTGKSFRLTR
ncbi:ubiquitin recognition factor in ER-associated degradation protein 1-like [Pistacia vera]|uniref:ubiquitin recognition factor in ER-associated degradation protein 1-like n=1 Tax=Pistacia vera TaxID=55513 RepID=UPI001263A550|nr:ubiquitin recognition factor in ER-associated degradation protein 1-like [Pistacia vera]